MGTRRQFSRDTRTYHLHLIKSSKLGVGLYNFTTNRYIVFRRFVIYRITIRKKFQFNNLYKREYNQLDVSIKFIYVKLALLATNYYGKYRGSVISNEPIKWIDTYLANLQFKLMMWERKHETISSYTYMLCKHFQ